MNKAVFPGIPDQVRDLLDTLAQSGFNACMVGGAVRDMLLGSPPQDVDLLTDAPLDTVSALFGKEGARQVGRTFPVCLVKGIEVSSTRSGRKNFPEADLGMRDFTINAMAWDPFSQTLWDPFHGRADLENRIIRFTGDPADRILEDPVRMVRACRFAARFEAALHTDTRQALEGRSHLLEKRAAPERIRMELIKAMAMKRPSVFFRLMQQTGLLKMVLPGLDRCFGLAGGPFHGETVFEHCLLVGDALPARQPLLRLAGYLHDTGKFDAQGIKDGRVTFHGHETHTQALETDLANLRFSNREKRYILSLVACHMRPLAGKTTPKSVRRLLAKLDALGLSHRDFLRMRIADKKGNLAKSPYTLSEIRLRLKKILDEKARSRTAAFSVNHLAVSGDDIMAALNLAPGPDVGRIKQALFEAVLDDPSLNERQVLIRLAEEMADFRKPENGERKPETGHR